MAIGDFDVVSISILPAEAEELLLVAPDAELAVPVAFECFQGVGRGNLQILQDGRFGGRACLDFVS